MKKNVKAIVAYEGTRYVGWEEVGTGPSIEGTLRAVLEQILQSSTPLQAASRTDAGVHATGQVVNFFLNTGRPLAPLKQGLNALLPPDIRVLSVEEAAEDFHPTLDAISKEYHYHLCLDEVPLPLQRGFSWHCPGLNIQSMEKAAQHLVGERDFGAFQNQSKEKREHTERALHALSFHSGETLRIVLKANAFLFRMARNIVGTLVQVGQEKIDPDSLPSIIAQKDRRLAGVCAPAHGLTLAHVYY